MANWKSSEMSFRMCLQSQNMQYMRPLLGCLNCKKSTISPYLSIPSTMPCLVPQKDSNYAAFFLSLWTHFAAITNRKVIALVAWILQRKYIVTMLPHLATLPCTVTLQNFSLISCHEIESAAASNGVRAKKFIHAHILSMTLLLHFPNWLSREFSKEQN